MPRTYRILNGVLGYLRAAWSAYVSENRRGWADLVDEQARNPTLD